MPRSQDPGPKRGPSEERSDGPTPNGGAYSRAFYRDLDGLPVPREDAVRIEYVEYTAEGREIHRTYAEPRDLLERMVLKMTGRTVKKPKPKSDA